MIIMDNNHDDNNNMMMMNYESLSLPVSHNL